ncbi:hypothetical protein [Novosphingobium barchaimii]|nr:hypothetical protein [Novosphingobium barchaimii]
MTADASGIAIKAAATDPLPHLFDGETDRTPKGLMMPVYLEKLAP